MTDLSPQAQAIVDTFDFEYYQKATTRQVTLAAVLRAVAKQNTVADTRVGVTEKVVLVDDILKIATELEQWYLKTKSSKNSLYSSLYNHSSMIEDCDIICEIVKEWLPNKIESDDEYCSGWNDYRNTLLESIK